MFSYADYDEVIHGNRRFVIIEKVNGKGFLKRRKAYRLKLFNIIFSLIKSAQKERWNE